MCQVFDRVCKRAAEFANRRGGDIREAERFINRTIFARSIFGVEYVSVADREAAYLNTGDTYSTTVVCEDRRCEVSTWGDWFETAEAEHCEAEGVIRCAYCGEFTELADGGEWRETVCESCGHYVDGSWPAPPPARCDYCGEKDNLTIVDGVTLCEECAAADDSEA